MTISEIKASDRPFLTAADVAAVLGADPQGIRWQAKHDPDRLGFPVVVVKARVKIPRLPFLKFIGEEPDDESKANV